MMFEGGIRVPLIFRWPGNIPGGQWSDGFGGALCGDEPPDQVHARIWGITLREQSCYFANMISTVRKKTSGACLLLRRLLILSKPMIMKPNRLTASMTSLCLALAVCAASGDPLETGFLNPPDSTEHDLSRGRRL